MTCSIRECSDFPPFRLLSLESLPQLFVRQPVWRAVKQVHFILRWEQHYLDLLNLCFFSSFPVDNMNLMLCSYQLGLGFSGDGRWAPEVARPTEGLCGRLLEWGRAVPWCWNCSALPPPALVLSLTNLEQWENETKASVINVVCSSASV